MSQDDNTVNYTDTDQMVVSAARNISDNEVLYVGVGLPTLAYLVAKHSHAPNSTVVVQNGTIRTTLYPLPTATDDLGIQTMADQLTSLFYLNCLAQAGFISTGFIGGGQVDRYGNVNDTVVGDYLNPVHRWPGSGGANDVVSFCQKTIIILRQSKRRFPEKVDFITCPGYFNGRPGQREEVGLIPGTGPKMVITNLGIYEFEDREMVLKSVHAHAGVTLEQVKAAIGWDIRVSPDLEETVPPTEEELRILREKVDTKGIWVGGKRTIRREEDKEST